MRGLGGADSIEPMPKPELQRQEPAEISLGGSQAPTSPHIVGKSGPCAMPSTTRAATAALSPKRELSGVATEASDAAPTQISMTVLPPSRCGSASQPPTIWLER